MYSGKLLIRPKCVEILSIYSRLNRLYVELLKTNLDWDTEERRDDMNHFLARVLILEANSLRENPSGPKSLNRNQFFKEPIKIDGYYFVPSGKPGLGYEYDEK